MNHHEWQSHHESLDDAPMRHITGMGVAITNPPISHALSWHNRTMDETVAFGFMLWNLLRNRFWGGLLPLHIHQTNGEVCEHSWLLVLHHCARKGVLGWLPPISQQWHGSQRALQVGEPHDQSLRPVSSILSVGLNPGLGQSMPETNKEDRGHKFHSCGLTFGVYQNLEGSKVFESQ
jgi:hypothetical protein